MTSWLMAINCLEKVYKLLKAMPRIGAYLQNKIADLRKPKFKRTYQDSYELFIDVVGGLNGTQESVCILKLDTVWFWTLGPSIVRARLENKIVRIICAPPADERERIRIGFLKAIGCEVAFLRVGQHDLELMLLDGERRYNSQAFTFYPQSNPSQNLYATHYSGAADEKMIQLLKSHFSKIWEGLPREDLLKDNSLKIQRLERAVLVDRLRAGVRQYNQSDVKVEFKNVPVDKIRFLSRKLYTAKYKQVPTLLKLYEQAAVSLFEPIQIVSAYGEMIITPPVVEYRYGNYYLICGSHRVYYHIKNNLGSVLQCVVASGVHESLPGKAVPVWKVELCTTKQSNRVKDLNLSLFRHIEGSMHRDTDFNF